MNNITREFIRYLGQKDAEISAPVFEKAEDCLCDYLAVTEAGGRANAERWNRFIRHAPADSVKIIGTDLKTDAKTACLINGFHAHCLELDDGHRFAMLHPGAAVITALYAAASENEIEKKDFLRGIILGYEAACRLSAAIQPSHKLLGFHASGTCGTIGAAIGTAFALNTETARFPAVVAAAVAGAAGILGSMAERSELKPYNLGRAAMDGLSAAYMGFTDFRGPEDILGGARGFFKLFGAEVDLERFLEEREAYEIERIYVKPYAACRHCHGAIEAMLALREQCSPKDIDSIEVEIYGLAIRGHEHTEIAGSASAKLSIPFSVAAACILGAAGADAFSARNAADPDILALAKKVAVRENSEFSACCPQKRITRVTLRLKGGALLAHQVDYAKGEPENPMRRDEIKDKAIALVGGTAARAIFDLAYSPERSGRMKL